MISFLVGIFPIDCTLASEEVHNISINLSRRTLNSLEGELKKGKSVIGKFSTSKPKTTKPAMWSFLKDDQKFEGEIILFQNNYIWHPFQNKIKSENVNRVLFSGLSNSINLISKDRDLLEASYGFFNIGPGCYGGRIKKS